MNVTDKLQSMNERLKAVQVQESGDAFQDGNYTARVEKAFLTRVKQGENQGELQVCWWLRITSGPASVNRIYFQYHPLYAKDDEQLDIRLSRLKTDLHRLELDITDMDQLLPILAAIEQTGPEIKFTLKTNKREGQDGIQNCYFNGLVKTAEPAHVSHDQ